GLRARLLPGLLTVGALLAVGLRTRLLAGLLTVRQLPEGTPLTELPVRPLLAVRLLAGLRPVGLRTRLLPGLLTVGTLLAVAVLGRALPLLGVARLRAVGAPLTGLPAVTLLVGSVAHDRPVRVVSLTRPVGALPVVRRPRRL